ncbi:MAG: lipase chaperone [Spirochaetes bacterium]|nr:lipase chaperone [Spirochaetota bacterium]
MKNRKIIALVISALLIALIYFTYRREKNDHFGPSIISNNVSISAQDIYLNLKGIKFDDANITKHFSHSVVTPFTVKFFKFLQRRFRDLDYESHLKAVEEYLYRIMDANRAAQMFELYKRFLEYEKKLIEAARKWPTPTNTHDAINYLRNVQKFRRDFFGNEIADILFGAQVKHQEYTLRKQNIINDKKLYAKEKEKLIKKLQEDMWGEDAATIDNAMRPYDQYREKLAIYEKDLSELDETSRKEKIKEFRQQYFSPEVVERLEKVDQEIEREKKIEEDYRTKEQRILLDQNLTAQQKEEKIRELQNEIFGDEADAFRRREAIRKAEEAFKK